MSLGTCLVIDAGWSGCNAAAGGCDDVAVTVIHLKPLMRLRTNMAMLLLETMMNGDKKQ